MSTTQESDLVNRFLDALTSKKWIQYLTKIKNTTKLSKYIREEENVYGYNKQRVQDAFNKMYGEENVYRYDISSNKFISVPKLEQNTEKITGSSRHLNREAIQGSDKQNNSKRL